jgi:hypothetical protein
MRSLGARVPRGWCQCLILSNGVFLCQRSLKPSCFKRHFSFTESRFQMPNRKRHGGLGT